MSVMNWNALRSAFSRWVRPAVMLCTVMLLLIPAANAATCTVSEVTSASVTCGGVIPVKVATDDDKKALAKLARGDVLEQPTANMSAAAIKVAVADIGGSAIPLALVFGVVVGLIYAAMITGGRFSLLLVGQDNRYSNSKVQAAGWMGVLLIAYLATCFLRWWAGMPWLTATNVGISPNLMAIAGLSAATGGGAKIATGVKAAAATAGGATKTPAAAPNFWSDVFKNDNGQWDVGDAQMILVAAISIILFMINVATFWCSLPLAAHIDLPEPTNVLTLALGGSLGAYLAKKIGGTVGSS